MSIFKLLVYLLCGAFYSFYHAVSTKKLRGKATYGFTWKCTLVNQIGKTERPDRGYNHLNVRSTYFDYTYDHEHFHTKLTCFQRMEYIAIILTDKTKLKVFSTFNNDFYKNGDKCFFLYIDV